MQQDPAERSSTLLSRTRGEITGRSAQFSLLVVFFFLV